MIHLLHDCRLSKYNAYRILITNNEKHINASCVNGAENILNVNKQFVFEAITFFIIHIILFVNINL